MSVEQLPRQLGCVAVCNSCKVRIQTGQVRKKDIRAYLETVGWGRGTDKGSRTKNGGRPSNLTHDLCPTCRAADRSCTAARATKRAEQIKVRDAKRKERDALGRARKEQAEAGAR